MVINNSIVCELRGKMSSDKRGNAIIVDNVVIHYREYQNSSPNGGAVGEMIAWSKKSQQSVFRGFTKPQSREWWEASGWMQNVDSLLIGHLVSYLVILADFRPLTSNHLSSPSGRKGFSMNL